ncbi:MAG: hypothetical protein COZ08_07290, partial [Bacteroidetes bacterium CG_4_10_14_3_um_filter_42_6]
MSKKSIPLDIRFETCRIGVGKRTFDIVFSLIALIVFFSFGLLMALAIKLDSKGPVFYVTQRVGTGYDLFDFYKFRTMIKNADQQRSQLSDMNQYLIS